MCPEIRGLMKVGVKGVKVIIIIIIIIIIIGITLNSSLQAPF
jgi:hypothetical protein